MSFKYILKNKYQGKLSLILILSPISIIRKKKRNAIELALKLSEPLQMSSKKPSKPHHSLNSTNITTAFVCSTVMSSIIFKNKRSNFSHSTPKTLPSHNASPSVKISLPTISILIHFYSINMTIRMKLVQSSKISLLLSTSKDCIKKKKGLK